MYSAIFISDIHMNRNLPHAKPSSNGRTDRLDDQLKLWRRVGKAAKKYAIQDIWILGDLFDVSRPDPVTLSETAGALSSLADDHNVYLLSGNHDAIGISGEHYVLDAFGAIKKNGIRRVKKRMQIRDWLTFYCLDYGPSDNVYSEIKKFRKEEANGVKVLLLHASILGCSHGSWVCDDGLDPRKVVKGFNWVLSGHFHNPQKFGGNKGLYLGAPLHLRFDDAGREAGFWKIDFREDGKIKRKLISGNCPKFHEIEWGEELPQMRQNDYLRYRISATASDWIKLKQIVEDTVSRVALEGYRVSYRVDPVYHHSVRIRRDDDSSGSMSHEEMIVAYVDNPTVETSGLDKNRLKSLGVEALHSTT